MRHLNKRLLVTSFVIVRLKLSKLYYSCSSRAAICGASDMPLVVKLFHYAAVMSIALPCIVLRESAYHENIVRVKKR